MDTININTLTPEQRKELLQSVSPEELKAAAKVAEASKSEARAAYKETVKDSVPEFIQTLLSISNTLSKAKFDLFQGLNILLEMKSEVYDIKQGQQGHSFSDDQGNGITYGFRVVDGWDDTVNAGIDKIKEVIDSMAKDDNSAKLVTTINKLLKKDAKGNLKSSRVLELRQLAEEFNDDKFKDAVEIIQDAYKPVRSAFFIEAYTTNAMGKKVFIPLSITAVDFPEGTNIEEIFPIENA
ncbi:DUF3164 family protein [Chryseobacterium sp. AG363]|uniref:DUF3164 family protein n=1 Tax=Chryseobacterium sp. AG363 TaxID=2183997 RepID=UPI000E710DC5|nr:DUF3164 family protein [Chryseobacterium sp. AG363]RKE81980.1 uncharacterized protein DUF3164 [Chryseobacterium sp. AG363]